MPTNHRQTNNWRLQSKRMCDIFTDTDYWDVVYYYGSVNFFGTTLIDRPLIPSNIVNVMASWAEKHKHDVHNVVEYIRSATPDAQRQLVSLAVILVVLARVNRFPTEW